MAESRLADRTTFFKEVDVLTHGEAMPQRHWGQNLSEAGMFLQTNRPLSPGDRVSLRFDVETHEVHVRAAEVVWVKRFEPINIDGQLPGVGLRFLSVDPPARAAIRRHVHSVNDPGISDVPAPPPEPELPDGDYISLASLRPLSLPPFDSDPPMASDFTANMPPPVTLPPTTLVPIHAASPSEPPIGSPTLRKPPSSFGTGTDVPAAARPANGITPLPRMTMPPTTMPPTTLPPSTLPPSTLPPSTMPPTGQSPTTLPPSAMPGSDRMASRPPVPMPATEARPSPEPVPGTDTEHPLAGWSFQVQAASLPPETAPQLDPQPEPAPTPSRVTVEESEEVRWSFQSDPPAHASQAPVPEMPSAGAPSDDAPIADARDGDAFERFDTLEDEEPVHTWPPERLGLSFEEEAPSARTSLPPAGYALDEADDRIDEVSCPPQAIATASRPAASADEQRRLDSAFFGGKLSVMELPQTEPRGTRVGRPQRNRAAWAVGLLVAGGAVGAIMGYEAPPPAQPVALEQSAPLPEPKPVALAEAGLFTEAQQPANAKVAPKATGSVKAAETKDAKVALTSAVAQPPPAPNASVSLVAEYGRVTIPLEGGRIVKAFGLSAPPRVVIDLADTTFPGHGKHTVDDKGIIEVRFGQPDPAHVRVVVELTGDRAPRDISTLKRSRSLAVAWK